MDNGNNNDLDTQAKVNYPPYGVDFADGPTGRFTNGMNQADFLSLSSLLALQYFNICPDNLSACTKIST